MTVIVTINGREAIPVRAVPLITNWNINAQNLAEALLFNDLFLLRNKRVAPLSAFHLPDGITPSRVLPAYWRRVCKLIEGLERELDAEMEATGRDNYQAWIDRSVLLLPAGLFVWRDEFEGAFATVFHPDARSFVGEAEGDRTLDYQPVTGSKEMAQSIMEGFGGESKKEPQLACPPVSDTTGPIPQKTVPKKRQHEDFILHVMETLGLDAANVLTENQSMRGKAGFRAQVKTACVKLKPEWASGCVFSRAWQSLRDKFRQEK